MIRGGLFRGATGRLLTSLSVRGAEVDVGASLSTATSACRALEDIIPKLPKENEKRQPAGCAWEAADLRKKSWDDLHKLWYVLLKERNLLQSEKLAYARQRQIMPDSSRLTKVKKSMNRIKQVMSERARLEHDDEQIKAYLKAFIDAM